MTAAYDPGSGGRGAEGIGGADPSAILESITDAFYALDGEWRFVYLNGEAERVVSRKRGELLGRNVWEEFPEAAGSTFEREYRRAVTKRTTVEFEEYYPPLGTWFGVKAYPSRAGLSVYFRDVTERRRAEEERERMQRALLESERRLRAILSRYSSDVVMFLDADGVILHQSPAVERVLGYAPEALVGEEAFGYIHPDDQERTADTFSEVLETPGLHGPVEYRFRHQDGSWRWMEAMGNNLLSDPDVRGIVINSRDVTPRKRADEELKEQRRLLREVIDADPSLVFVKDWDGRFTLANKATADIYGTTVEGLLGKADADFNAKKEEVAEFLRADREVMRTLERRRIPEEPVTDSRTGEVRWFQTVKVPLRSWDGKARRVLGVSADITERRRFEGALRESEERFRSLIHNVSDIITVLEADGVIRYESPSVERVLGHKPEELVGTNVFAHVHPEDLERVRRFYSEGMKTPGTSGSTVECRFRHADGSWRYLEAVGSNLLADPNVGGIVVNSRDVTGRKEAEAALAAQAEKLREQARVLDLAPVLTRDLDDRVLMWNSGAEVMYGYSAEEALGKVTHELLRSEHPEPVGEIKAKILREGRWEGEIVRARKDGARVVASLQVLHEDERGRPSAILEVSNDVTDRKVLEERLAHEAAHDALTGLPNRALFMDLLGHALAGMARQGNKIVAVLFMDLDDFKVVNDSLGHGAGDGLLVAVSERLRESLRPTDTAARFGGDEFVVLLEDVADAREAVRVAERVAEGLIGEPFRLGEHEVSVAPSIGIVLSSSAKDSPEDLLRDAAAAMYQAKKERAYYRVFDPIVGFRAMERLRLEGDLRKAIGREEFEIHYQPKVELGSGRVVGFEALVRWRHPERDLMLPGGFVPLAEETGLIAPIGRWVLEEACREAKKWQEGYPADPPLEVCVNFSARQFRRPGLLRDVEESLRKCAIPPASLTLEITESFLMEDPEESAAALGELKALGVRLAIDDFGTGYSSLSYLERLPVDFLKIARSFVRRMGRSPEDSKVASAIVGLAHALGMEVVAEGVERAAQAAQLRQLGCGLAQGFYFAGPLPADAARALLTAEGADTGRFSSRH